MTATLVKFLIER